MDRERCLAYAGDSGDGCAPARNSCDQRHVHEAQNRGGLAALSILAAFIRP
ncbi:hypothetical protein HMPREF0762_00377 [Slackia exigua ATCC 700122]|uniref:Uncharacterized protein n=1 Tax=Slackia exigua (strain ATCC 700122 / DSM 15923 / CIP 105133 / JCM 11022 / KCTC 5966 / S-7) TaxID=649764 RepID=D0WEZ1_SLAES|nr:hypothetical protein HMPREF0762_00377 [Slackia exigua ATCC 700122]